MTFVPAALRIFTFVSILSLAIACGDSDAPGDTGTADTGTADTSTADTGTADTGAADSALADSATVDTGAADSAAGDTGATDGAADGGGTVTFCTDAGGCASGQTCFSADVTCSSDMGFCVATDAPTCGGFAGTACPSGLVCVNENPTCGGADIQGVCVTAAERTEICATQPTLWSCAD